MKVYKKIISTSLAILSSIQATNLAFAGNEENADNTNESPATDISKTINETLEETSEANAHENTNETTQNELLQERTPISATDQFIAEYLESLRNRSDKMVNVPLDMIDKTINDVNIALGMEQRDLRNGIRVNVYEGDVIVVGDTHGDFNSTSLIIRAFLNKLKTNSDEKILFLGDYVDRGSDSVKNFIVICALKAKFPDNVYMLRGNHENISLNEKYGLFEEFNKKYSDCGTTEELSKKFNSVYANLPLCAILDDKIFCVHGGIPYPSDDPNYYKSEQYYFDVLWSDPWYSFDPQDASPIDKIIFNDRGFSFNYGRNAGNIFNKTAFMNFLDTEGLESVVRSHQVFDLKQSRNITSEYDGKLFCIYSTTADFARQSITERGYVLIYDCNERTFFYEYIKNLNRS